MHVTGAREDAATPDKRRILIAEDDTELRRLLALALTGDGYEVVEAVDGRGLIEQIAKLWLIDAVISDVRMPGRSGLDVLAGFRRADWTTPFVLITAFGSEELHERAYVLGASAVFDKPFELDELRNVIRALVPPDLDTPSKVVRFGGRRRRVRERDEGLP